MKKTNNDNLVDRLSNFDDVTIRRISLCSLLMWIFYPIIVMILNYAKVDGMLIYLIWTYVLYFVGGIGLFVGLVSLLKTLSSNILPYKMIVYRFLPLLLLALFLVWSLISCLLAKDKYLAFVGSIPFTSSWITFLFFGGFLLSSLTLSKNDAILVGKSLLTVSSILSIVSLMDNSFTEKVNVIMPYTNCFHYQSVFYNTNHYAYYLLITTLIAFFFVLYSNKLCERVVGFIIYSMQIALLILNNTFGAYLSLGLTILFVIIWSLINNDNGKNLVLVLASVFVLISFTSVLYTDNLKNSVLSFANDIETVIDDEDTSAIGSGRGVRWKNAIDCTLAQPIFGCGFENQGKFIIDGSENAGFVYSPHNYFLFLSKHTGIPGLMLILTTLIVGIVRMYKQKDYLHQVDKASGFIVIAFLMSAFFGVVKFYTEPYFVLVLGLCMKDCVGENMLERLQKNVL